MKKKKDDKTPKKGNSKKPIIPKKDQNGDAIKKAPKGVDKVVRTNQGNIIMVSSSTGFSDKPKKTAKPAKAPAEPKKTGKPKTIHLQGIYGQHPAVKASELKPGDITVWNGGYTEKIIAVEPSKSGKTVKATIEYESMNGKTVRTTRKFGADRLVGIDKPKKPAESKKPATPKTATAKKPAVNRESNRLDSKSKTTSTKKPAQLKLPKELRMTSKEHDDYEKGITGEPLLPLGLKPKTKKELRHVVKGGFTVWDGLQRTGKTFETKQEADDYADDFYKKTGIKVSVTSTRRNVTHTFRPEQQRKKK